MTPPDQEKTNSPFAAGSGSTLALATLLWATAVFLWKRKEGNGRHAMLGAAASFWLLILYFFRDPDREVTDAPGLVVSPADGEVVEINRERETRYLGADVIRISIFLSLFDVHVQRIPLGGTVGQVIHQPGQFLPAFKAEASEANEHIAMTLHTEYGRILVKQIAGILARRCLNHRRPGEIVRTGSRFGMIKFSSRVDLFLPPEANLLVTVGDKVHGGISPIAQLGADS
jgi:phosphatidylserine decarboxylase